jgi:hypothetical protein
MLPAGIRTLSLSKRVAAGLRLRPVSACATDDTGESVTAVRFAGVNAAYSVGCTAQVRSIVVFRQLIGLHVVELRLKHLFVSIIYTCKEKD